MPTPLPSGYLPEHAGTAQQEQATGYSPTDSEKSAIALVEKCFADAKRHRSTYDTKWAENYNFFRGKQWTERRPTYRHSEVLNYIFTEVLNVVVLLTDNRPTIEILPEDPTDYEFAEILNNVIKYKWDSKNWNYTLAECIIDAAIYGTAISHVPWKQELERGLGDFAFESKDLFYFFPDPFARSAINDEFCDYTVTAEPVKVSSLKAKYPDKADFIKSDVGDLSAQDREFLDEIKYKSPTDNRVRSESTTQHSSRPNQVIELTLYIKSEDMEEEELDGGLDELTGLRKKLYQTKKKYPNGRKIVVANGVLLEDNENPYEDGKFPYARLVDTGLPREFWGVGEVDQLKSPQRIVNKLISYVLDVLTIMGNPIWVVDTTAQVDTDNVTNQPGLVIEKSPGGEVRRESGVGLQPFVMETLQFMANNVMQKLGSTAEVSKGVSPTDNASGYAIAQLQEAAQTKIRGKSRNVEVFLKDNGDLFVSRILQNYTVPRIIRLTSNAESAKYFKFAMNEVEDETGEVKKVAEVQEYTVDPMTNQYIEGPVRQIPLKSSLDVRVNVGSSLPFAKIENKAMAEKLYDKKIIDTEEFLTQIEYPYKEKVLERLRKQAQMMMAMPPQGDPNAPGTNAGSPGTSPGAIPA